MKAVLLTEEQKDNLVDVQYTTDIYFNPVLDGNNNWIISVDEIENVTNKDFLWVKNLPIIDYITPIWD